LFSSVDSRSNRVKVSRYNRSSGQREVFVASDSDSAAKIGVLQHYAKVSADDRDTSLAVHARALLALHNRDSRRLSVRNALGDTRARAGSCVTLDLRTGGITAAVTRCTHRFSGQAHTMDLEMTI
jgi:hypothetical protein